MRKIFNVLAATSIVMSGLHAKKAIIPVSGLSPAATVYTENTEEHQKKCDDGSKRSCLGLALYYFEGEKTEKDYSKSGIYAKKACELGSEKGCKIDTLFVKLGITHEKIAEAEKK